jgi:hypothetical protein
MIGSKTNQYEIIARNGGIAMPPASPKTPNKYSDCYSYRNAKPVTIAPGEHSQWQWLGWKEAAEKCFSTSNRDAILELPARLQQVR